MRKDIICSFDDNTGRPLPLPVSGAAPSFESLFKAYGGDTPEQTLIRELENAGSVGRDDAGHLVALRRYHMPAEMDEGNVRFFGTNLHDHAKTLCNNLTQVSDQRLLEGFAVDDSVHPEAVEEFRAFLDKRGQEILEEIDDWLNEQRRFGSGLASMPSKGRFRRGRNHEKASVNSQRAHRAHSDRLRRWWQ